MTQSGFGGVDLLIGKLWLRAVLRGVDLLIGKLSLRAVLKTGAAPTKKCARTTNVGHSLCPKKCFEDLRFFDVALLGLLAAVLGLASKLVLRAVLAGVELLECFITSWL